MPIIAGSEINDDPYEPVSKYARDLIHDHGDDTTIAWIHRDDRYGEKLATPDTSIADLIGEVDPIKVAEGRYLSDELTLHYGLVPRTNRGIFAMNELPDLAERIQVGLLNVLEERDVQVRGYKIRLPLDVLLVASANPDDYTNRGRIITPLKDRFGSQIRTHYPLEVETEVAIMRQEARPASVGDVHVTMPDYMDDVVAEFSHLARQSSHVNQRSGVSVRLSVSNSEVLAANAVRRALRSGEREVVPRICDLEALAASTAGKIEIESLEEGREGQIIENMLKGAVLAVFKQRLSPDKLREVITAFDEGVVAHTGEDLTSVSEAELVGKVPALREPVAALTRGDESPAAVASAIEFVLEGLHLSKRLNKESVGGAGHLPRAAAEAGSTRAGCDGCSERGEAVLGVAVAVEEPVGHREAEASLVAVDGAAMEPAAQVDPVGASGGQHVDGLSQQVAPPLVVGRPDAVRRHQHRPARELVGHAAQGDGQPLGPRGPARLGHGDVGRVGLERALGGDRDGPLVGDADDVAGAGQVGDLLLGEARHPQDAVAEPGAPTSPTGARRPGGPGAAPARSGRRRGRGRRGGWSPTGAPPRRILHASRQARWTPRIAAASCSGSRRPGGVTPSR